MHQRIKKQVQKNCITPKQETKITIKGPKRIDNILGKT